MRQNYFIFTKRLIKGSNEKKTQLTVRIVVEGVLRTKQILTGIWVRHLIKIENCFITR